MKLISIAQARDIDRRSIRDYGIPSGYLMENAGAALANELLRRYPNTAHIVVVCGKGNNGGDGSVAARHLHAAGRQVTLILMASPQQLSGDAATAFELAQRMGVPVELGLTSTARERLTSSCVIVDALLGIGAKGAPSGEIQQAIEAINQTGKPVLSADIPSGANGDTGAVEGCCVKATVTVTFGLCKIGLMCYPAKAFAGDVVVQNISFAPGAVARQNIKTETIEPPSLPDIPEDAHKGSCGKVFVLSGSAGFTGAAYFNATAAMRMGCGLATLGIPQSLNPIMEQKLTEVMTLPLPDREGALSAAALPMILEQLPRYTALVCGSGLSQRGDVPALVRTLVTQCPVPMVLDADGLNALAGHVHLLQKSKCPAVVTPHVGEMARLTGLSIHNVQGDTVGVAQRFAVEYNVTTVLKSAHTVVALPDGTVRINTNGNSGMATAGSGDVLAGMIGALLSQGHTPAYSAFAGVFLHGRAGDLAAAALGKRAMLATDIVQNIAQTER